jgi:hypothetical protein
MDEQQNPIVRWPFGAATIIALAATIAAGSTTEIVNSLTVIDGATTPATADRTLNLAIDKELTAGARLILKTKSAATQTLIPGTGMTGETITGVAGKTQVAEYVYDGTAFIQTGKFIQID